MNFKWTKEKCKEEALKYNSRNEFKKLNSSSYDAARRNNWLNEITTHMFKPYDIKIKWNKEKCREAALKCISRSEFSINYSRAYNLSLKNNWIDEICYHMLKKGNLIKRCIYAYEFSDNHAYIGLTYNLENRHYRHMNNDNHSSVYKHILNTKLTPKLIQLTDYISINIASITEEKYVNEYKKNNWLILNKVKAGSIGGSDIKWSKNKCHEEALKYNNIKDFFNNSKRAYIKSRRNKWLDEICSHMLINKMYKSNKTKEKCHEEALKYKSRNEYHKKSPAFYTFAKRHNWLDEICSHMIKTTKPMNYWTKEKCAEVSLICKNKKQFQKKYGSAYSSAYKNKWLDELFKKPV